MARPGAVAVSAAPSAAISISAISGRLPSVEHDVGDPLTGGDEVGVGLDPAGWLAVAEALAEEQLEAGGDAAGPRRQG
ncbi:MAG: hypothetical protein U1E53_02010 [Dongiaceae bacterium]